MTKPTAPDWERIETAYRTGIKSLREIGDEHGLTEGAIRKRAKRDGWERDLSGKVRAKAEALVRKELVRSTVRSDTLSERELVDGAGKAVAVVDIRHREDLKALRDAAIAMLDELRRVGEGGDTLDEIAKVLSEKEDGTFDTAQLGRLREALHRATSLPGRITSIKALAETITKLVDAERVAWKLDDADQGRGQTKPLSDAERASRLATIMERARQAATSAAPPAVSHAVH